MHRPRAEDYLIIWVMGGAGFAETEGRRVVVGPGVLLTFAKGEAHSYGSDQRRPWDIVWLHFDGPAAADLFAEIRGGRVGPDQPLALDPLLQERFLELVSTRAVNTPPHRRLADRLAWGLLGLIAHRLSVPAMARSALGPIAAVQQHIHDHLADPLTVEDLARVARTSPRHLSRLMKQMLGRSPMGYVIDQRIALATTLLRESDLIVKEVAAAVGYDDPFHFTRLFLARTGFSPSEYRRRETAKLRPSPAG